MLIENMCNVILNKNPGENITLLNIVLIILMIGADQLTKILTDSSIAAGTSIPLIPKVLELTNVHNNGAAWGMMSGGRWFFIILTIIVCALLIYILFSKKYCLTKLAHAAFLLVLGGAIGNLVDRIFLGYVRDMIFVSCINFPVFNVADSCVTIGACLLILDTIINKKNSFFGKLDESSKKSNNKKSESETEKEIAE